MFEFVRTVTRIPSSSHLSSISTLSNHQTVVKVRASGLNFHEGPIPVSEFVNCTERGKLGAESDQSRVIVGSTCLSVTKVPPDYAAHIPPILGGHPVTSSRGKTFFPERKTNECEGVYTSLSQHTPEKHTSYNESDMCQQDFCPILSVSGNSVWVRVPDTDRIRKSRNQ
jgi:hypothetical protein